MLAAERRPRDEIFTHREPADDNGLEPDLPNQVRGNRKRILVISGDRHTDQFALAMGIFAQLHIVDRIEPADDMRPGQQLRRGRPAPPCCSTDFMSSSPSRRAIGLLTSSTSAFLARAAA